MTYRASVLIAVVSLPYALACGGIDEESAAIDRTHTEPPTSNDGAPDSAFAQNVDAAVPDALPPASLPTCSVQVTGDQSFVWRNADVTASLGGLSENPEPLMLGCSVKEGTGDLQIQHSLTLLLNGVDGAGVYNPFGTYGIIIDGDVYESSDANAPCAVTINTFSPGSRGGLVARFDCPKLTLDEAFGVPSSTISLQGSIDMPPVGPGAAPILVDAGTDGDAGAPSCTIQVSGAYSATSNAGIGFAVGNDTLSGPAGAGTISCTTTVDGTSYALGIDFGLAAEAQGSLDVGGESWCTVGCDVTYVTTSTPCSVDVTTDEGIGGMFRATFDCESLSIGVGAAFGMPVRAMGSIDGVHQSQPTSPKG